MRKMFAFVAILIAVALVPVLVGQRDRYAGTPGVVRAGTDTFFATKTVIKTISIDDDASVDDFQFDDDAANTTEQPVNLGALIPAWGELVSVQVRCIEAVVSTGADPDNITSLDIGLSTGAGDILATDTIDDLDDLITTAAAGAPLVAATAAAKSVWINLAPEDNWSTISAGRWAVIVTYIDYGAVYSANH